MAPLISKNAKNLKEDLVDIINDISPTATPVLSAIGKTSAKQQYHSFMTDTLSAADANNAAPEGADAPEANNYGPNRVGNFTQIFRRPVTVSNSLIESDTAGAKNEFIRQVVKAGKEMKLDNEASIVSDNASVQGTATVAGKSAGMGAWLSTNAMHGAGGSTEGFGVGNTVAPVVDGTTRPLTESMLGELLEKIYAHADPDDYKLISNPVLRNTINAFSGNATKYNMADKKSVVNTVELYDSSYGTLHIGLSRYLKETSIIAFNPELWAWASLRPLTKIDLGVTGDSKKMLLISEGTLEAKNEAGNGKIADVTPA